jgi:hypothetical protein
MMVVFVCANSSFCVLFTFEANYEAKNEAKGGEAKNFRGKKKHLKKNTAFNEKAADKRYTPPRRRRMMMMMMVRE